MKRHVANLLTYARLVLTPLIALLLWHNHIWSAWICLCAAAATDYFDGFFAKRWNMTSPFGAFLDAFADKVFITTTGMILIALKKIDGIHILPCAIVLWRELFISSIRMLPGKTPQSRKMPRIKTLTQTTALSFLLGSYLFPWLYPLGISILWFSCLLTVISIKYYWHKIKLFYF